jgi:predicted NBD/HSP70 family sugar kinase
VPELPRADTSGGPIVSPRAIGDLNRSRVLQTLVDHGPLSRADLARFANVTRATIGNIVGSLLDAGVLEEQEVRGGHPGKPARPVWFARRGALVAVVSLEERGLEAALVDATGQLVAEHTTRYATPAPTAADLRRAIRRALDDVVAQAGGAELLGVGVAVPGMCLASGEVAASSVLPALTGSWLRDLLSDRYGAHVVVDTDSRAQALAEKWFGLGRGSRAFAAVRISEGVGAGIVLDGTVFRAHVGIGGEFGHTVVAHRDGLPCRCGRRGCWQTIAGTDWVRREARKRGIRGSRSLDCAALVARAEAEPAVASLMAEYADNIAVGLANLVHVYNPQRVVLNGEVLAGHEVLRVAVAAALRARLVRPALTDVHVVLSELAGRASLLGAAALVLSERYQLAV